MPAHAEPDVTLPWLVRLRWLLLVCEAVAVTVAWHFKTAVSWWVVGAALALGVGSNLALAIGRIPRWLPITWVTGLTLALDIALLTVQLAASGGPSNPFTVLFLVHITLSALVLSAAWTSVIAGLSVVGYGLLFVVPAAAPAAASEAAAHLHAGHTAAMSSPAGDHGMGHLEGMWIAFVLASGLTGFFVRRITRAIAAQREQIATLREAAARNARLAALTTLAAGAAHELGSPLATISVAAHEAHRAARAAPGSEPLAEDLALIEREVDRCQHILHRMAARAPEPGSGPAPLHGLELIERVRAELGERADRVELRLPPGLLAEAVPVEPLVQSLVALIRNGLDASPAEATVVLEGATGPAGLTLTVRDHGPGIPADVLARVGDPFFTTKQPGRGLGLGVFLARAFVESRGGGLGLESTPSGTLASLTIPTDPTVVAPAITAPRAPSP